MDKAQSLAEKNDFTLAIFSDNEIAHYNWEVLWHRINNNSTSQINYLQPTKIIRNYALNNNIEFIENVIPHYRARNDPHPNIKGNEAIAENIFRYLMNRHKSDMERHRIKISNP